MVNNLPRLNQSWLYSGRELRLDVYILDSRPLLRNGKEWNERGKGKIPIAESDDDV